MQISFTSLSKLGMALLVTGFIQAEAVAGPFYDPANAKGKSGMTEGYELFGTIGCPGRQLLDPPCPPEPIAKKEAPKEAPKAAPAPPPPRDSDGDGVIDDKDLCPNTAPGATVNPSGCELDSDGDGVVDRFDQCPDTPRGVAVNAAGCPLDSDGDGVYDSADQCPGTPQGDKVDAKGCPLDSDGDGVYDSADQCPDTPQGDKVDAQGCSLLTFESVSFNLDRSAVLPAAVATLDAVAETLKKYPSVTVEIGGHTDSDNDDAYNQRLSERRSISVVDYLVSKGISASRLVAVGYGESQPIAPNDIEANKARNRRVEIKQIRPVR